MKINSAQLGQLDYEEKDIIHFKNGLYGFEQYTKYLYIQNDSDSIFSYLQSTENQGITFIVVNGYETVNNFELKVSKKDLEEIKIEENDDVCSLLIVTVPKDVSRISVNLLGPLVVNAKERLGKQMISLDPSHTTRHYLLENPALSVVEKIG